MHFTYEGQPRSDLQQGDLIKRTEAVEALLKEVHPHYFYSQNYRYFLVLTQSCDLARRDGKPCIGRYISIAAVRPVRTAIEREVQKLQHSEVERLLGFCSTERQPKLTQFMERLLNNNAEDYFYLHREQSAGFLEDNCAFLQLSIALRAQTHYDTLLAARILSLKESFQHKLGYLVGSLYSRVGTEDWLERHQEATQFRELTQQPAKDSDLVLWLDKDVHRKVLDTLKALPDPKPEDLQKAIADTVKSRETRKGEVLAIIVNVLSDLSVPDDTVRKVRTRLENRADFAVKFK
jgi:hypothetical protein